MKTSYFTKDKDGLKNEDSLNKEIIIEKNEATSKKIYFNLIQIMKRFWHYIKAFFKYTFIFLGIFFFLLIISESLQNKTLYIAQHLLGDSETHFRYKVLRCGLIDYYDTHNFQIENDVLQSKAVNDILYVYGVSGYTKVHLTFKTDIEKAVNKRYDANFLTTPMITNIRWYRNSDIKKYYNDGFIIKEDFSDFTDEDIKNFVELTEEEKKYEDPYHIRYDYIYTDPEDVRRGNTELTQLLYKEYENRFGPLKSYN